MQLKVGRQLGAASSTARAIVIRAPEVEIEVTCAGEPMVEVDDDDIPPEAIVPDEGDAVSICRIGKRYAEEELGVELLCTNPGAGPFACDGRVCLPKAPKPLPASD